MSQFQRDTLILMLASQDGEAWNSLEAFLLEIKSESGKSVENPIKDLEKWNIENIRANGAMDIVDKIINRLKNLKKEE